MKDKKQNDPKLILLYRCEKYFYKYLLTYGKIYIDRFFSTSARLKRLIKNEII